MITLGKQKYYAVRVGRQVGIFDNWPECQKQINGYPGQAFKSFSTKKEAEEYLNGVCDLAKEHCVDSDSTIVYIDGVYLEDSGIGSYGVIIKHDSKNRIEYGKFNYQEDEDMKEAYIYIVAVVKALEIVNNYSSRKVIIYSKDKNNLEDITKYENESIRNLMSKFDEAKGNLEIEFKNYENVSVDYQQVKMLARYAAEDNMMKIIHEIQYHECDCHNISNFDTIKGLNISAKNYIDKIMDVCKDINVTACLKSDTNVDNDKHIIIYFNKNYLNSEIHLHVSTQGLTVDVRRGKNHELNYLIVKEVSKNNEIVFVEEKKYSYAGLDEQQIKSVIENIRIFDDGKEYEIKENKLFSHMKYSYTIKNAISNEKVHVYVYTNNKLEIRGVKYLLWEDVCYVIEKSIGVTLNDIIGRMNIGVDLKFKIDNVDSSEEQLKEQLGEELIDFLYSYDYDVILSVKCSFEAKVKVSDYGIYIDPLTKAVEGYLKKILLHLKIVETEREINKSAWRFSDVFDEEYELKSNLHDKLNNDIIIRQKQLEELSKLCELMWTLRNKINHSGPKGTISYNNYEKGLKSIMKLHLY